MKSVSLLGIHARAPLTMKMHTACMDGIKIHGATILCFSGTSPSGGMLETRQLMYITDDSDTVFLSREACKELGMVSEQFPTIGKKPIYLHTHISARSAITHDTTDSPIPPCKCPETNAPSKPTQLVYPANEANRQHLPQWLQNYYASSTFNTCEHQPLPLMDTLPLTLMVKSRCYTHSTLLTHTSSTPPSMFSTIERKENCPRLLERIS